MTASRELIKFIKEARKRGFGDYEIRKPLIEHGWPLDKIEEGFEALKPKYKFKNQVCVFLSNDILKVIDKRAKKNMLTTSEQIEDILRRSCLNAKKMNSSAEYGLDDTFIKIFSRKRTGRPRKNLRI